MQVAELVSVNPYSPDAWALREVAQGLARGDVAVIPTDTVYTIVCSVDKRKAGETLYRLKGPSGSAAGKPLSVLFRDLSEVADYTRGLPNIAFKSMKRALPGPFTFILRASKRIPSAALQGRKTIGVRIPDHPVTREMMILLDAPLLCTSVYHMPGDMPLDDPIEISSRFGNDVDWVVDAGPIYPEPSTVVDLSGGSVEILREGKGELSLL